VTVPSETEQGDATAIRPFEDENLLVNMSVWRNVESSPPADAAPERTPVSFEDECPAT
jgi:Domain of unknown function (DUF3291)